MIRQFFRSKPAPDTPRLPPYLNPRVDDTEVIECSLAQMPIITQGALTNLMRNIRFTTRNADPLVAAVACAMMADYALSRSDDEGGVRSDLREVTARLLRRIALSTEQ